MNILVLGGIGEAIDICNNINKDTAINCNVFYSLAGVTKSPNIPADCTVITGGFGGISGLQKFIKDNDIRCVICATHPYAKAMTSNGLQACKNLAVPYARYYRQGWQKNNSADWHSFDTIGDIANAIKDIDGDILVAIGAKHIDKFANCKGHIVARMVNNKTLDNMTTIVGRGSFTLENETALFDKYDFKAIVCKNSGTEDGFYKVQLAQKKGIPIYILQRPKCDCDVVYNTTDEILNFIKTI